MDFDQMERKFKANMAEAFYAWVLADEDTRPLYKMACEKAESRLNEFYREHGASGEHARAVML